MFLTIVQVERERLDISGGGEKRKEPGKTKRKVESRREKKEKDGEEGSGGRK